MQFLGKKSYETPNKKNLEEEYDISDLSELNEFDEEVGGREE